MIKVIEATAADVAERWRKHYEREDHKWLKVSHGDAHKIYDRLCDLGPNPNIEKVAEVLGNKSWSHINCGSCGEYVSRVVALGEYDPKMYCPECITKAYEAL